MKPIGVFDSGIGGLTVVRALRELLPNENIFYLGDTARVPYGNKSAETVERYSLELARMLMAEDAKLIVVACNTVSSVAIPKLRASVSVPVIGVIEPGAHAAIAMTRNRHVGVIGTRATIRSSAYENELRASSQRFVRSTIARHHIDFRRNVGHGANRRGRSLSQHCPRRFAATGRRGAATCGILARLARGRLCTTKS